MPKPVDDPMRYIPTKEEVQEAYEQAPACHHPPMTLPLGALPVVRSAEED